MNVSQEGRVVVTRDARLAARVGGALVYFVSDPDPKRAFQVCDRLRIG